MLACAADYWQDMQASVPEVCRALALGLSRERQNRQLIRVFERNNLDRDHYILTGNVEFFGKDARFHPRLRQRALGRNAR